MSLPTKSEEFAKLVEYLRKAQESAYNIAHLTVDESELNAKGWRGIGELLGKMVLQVTQFATKGRFH